MSVLNEVFGKISTHLEKGSVGDFSAVYLFNLTGDVTGTWSLSVDNGQGKVSEGDVGNATCTITMDGNEFVKLVKGEANAQMLFMTGKLKVAGAMAQALKLQKVLSTTD